MLPDSAAQGILGNAANTTAQGIVAFGATRHASAGQCKAQGKDDKQTKTFQNNMWGKKH